MSNQLFVERSDSMVDAICKAVDYNGRKVKLKVAEKVTLSGTYWSGGSKSTYIALNLATMEVHVAPGMAPPQFGGPSDPPVVPLTDGMAIVEHSVFCGKDMGLTVYINPTNAAPMLPVSVSLTTEEVKVLSCTRGYKSSYAGIKDYRFSQSGLTRQAWDTAKQACQAKGFLDKRGAITTAGKNALNGHPRPSGGTY